jgi:pimeloyl-ACP methyl ester carboxylesterase
MGGAMAVYLAARHREVVRAVIGFEAPDTTPVRRSQFFCHPRVNQAAHNPTYAYGLMCPLSPEVHRKRQWWYYSQSGYGVYDGDMQFAIDEWNTTDVVNEIDTDECPVYLLSGNYDFSASPDSTRRLAARIPGVRFTVAEGLGHFPMSENPDLFRSYLAPVLEELKKSICGH